MLRLKRDNLTITLRQRPNGEHVLTIRQPLNNGWMTDRHIFSADNVFGPENVADAIKRGDVAFFVGE